MSRFRPLVPADSRVALEAAVISTVQEVILAPGSREGDVHRIVLAKHQVKIYAMTTEPITGVEGEFRGRTQTKFFIRGMGPKGEIRGGTIRRLTN